VTVSDINCLQRIEHIVVMMLTCDGECCSVAQAAAKGRRAFDRWRARRRRLRWLPSAA
jgi:hypothetical protein